MLYPPIFEGELCRYDRELCVPVQPFQTVRQKIFLRIPIANLAGATHMEHVRIEAGDVMDATLFRPDCLPEIVNPSSDAGDRANTGNDRASSPHAITLCALASTYAFMQRNVLFATL